MTERNPWQCRNTDFTYRVAVVCPSCSKCAWVLGAEPEKLVAEYASAVRFSCTSCGHSIRYTDTPEHTAFINSRGIPVKTRVLYMNAPCDPYFRLAAWYQIETPWGLLWAYNEEHLEVIERFVADKLRSRNGLPMLNNSLASRLPQWVTDSRHREAILKYIQRFKAKQK